MANLDVTRMPASARMTFYAKYSLYLAQNTRPITKETRCTLSLLLNQICNKILPAIVLIFLFQWGMQRIRQWLKARGNIYVFLMS